MEQYNTRSNSNTLAEKMIMEGKFKYLTNKICDTGASTYVAGKTF